MGHGHGHGQAVAPASASGRYVRSLTIALGIGAGFMVLEFIVGFTTGSLALISDAAHMFTDVLGVGMALAAIILARRTGPTVSDPPAVPGLPVLLAATAGLVANIVSFAVLRSGAKESLNVRGAYLEVLADLIGSVGVLLSGALTLLTGWRYADPIIGVAIGLFVLPRTWTLARRALRILFQHAPQGVDVGAINAELAALPGVADVHDLHVWTLTSGMEVASAHLTLAPPAKQSDVLTEAQNLLASRYAIEHATLQVEAPHCARRCQELSW
jgi:cobalt-zinc-cadmium efflux system protein